MLTEREIEVLKLLSSGLKQVEVSKKLKISQPAVSDLYNNALKKVRESYEILKIAEEIGLDANS